MLPNIVPKSRIMVYNYDSKWHSNAPHTRLQICGEDLIRSIHSFRHNNGTSTPDRPILLIGHSLGGNVIQHVSPMAWLSGT
jgi:triacylglycerol esterase/lipase EstA (alpha/beta hydrolase family)